jgi:cytochrome b
MAKIRVWDGFIRGYHWLQVGLLFGLWYCADEGEMDWHFIFGYALLAIWLTRIIWGFIGSDTAKFSYFLHHPAGVLHYLRNKDKFKLEHFGHNAAGGSMVVMLLLLLFVQLFTGLSASDGMLSEGPLVQYFSAETVNFMTWVHKNNFNVLLVAIGFHIGAVIVYKFNKKNLTWAMFSGTGEYRLITATALPKIKNGLFAWIICVIIAGLVWWQWGHENLGYLLY